MEISGPYRDSWVNFMYQLLFCDDLELYKVNTEGAPPYPLNVIYDQDSPVEELQGIVANRELDPRCRILASERLLKETGESIEAYELLAVIVEVANNGGLDTLAAFCDGTARYINYTEKMLVYEDQDEEVEALTDDLFNKSIEVVNGLAWFADERDGVLAHEGDLRMTFILTDGRCVTDLGYEEMLEDPAAREVFQAAGMLLSKLTDLAVGEEE